MIAIRSITQASGPFLRYRFAKEHQGREVPLSSSKPDENSSREFSKLVTACGVVVKRRKPCHKDRILVSGAPTDSGVCSFELFKGMSIHSGWRETCLPRPGNPGRGVSQTHQRSWTPLPSLSPEYQGEGDRSSVSPSGDLFRGLPESICAPVRLGNGRGQSA